MVRSITLSLLVSCMFAVTTQAVTYPGVLFENSVLGGNYMHSNVYHDEYSWVENAAGRLPVSDSIFFTPGNSLSLKYISAGNGDWRTQITFPEGANSYLPDAGDVLTFKLYVVSHTESRVLPRMAVNQRDTVSNAFELADYIDGFRTNMWLDVRVPVTAIGGLQMGQLVDGVQLSQGQADTATHWLYIDQIEFVSANPPRAKLSSPAVLASATAYDRHVDLTWQLPLTPSIRYIKVYRAEDNEHFEPIAIRPVFVQKYTDFVPYPKKTYYYKIAWVDYDYLESPFSDVVEATTHIANDSTLLNVMQAAHFNYFMERAEINSGMHATHFGVDDATVSVMETGLSILAHVVAVDRGFISRKVAVGRLRRMVDFLAKVERYHGAFPAKIDGRTGKGVFNVDTIPEADLAATAFLMQGLLVAEQYFGTDSTVADLTGKINGLWDCVEWNQFVVAGQQHILLDRWSPVTGFKDARPMGGFGSDFISYILALASPRYSVHPDAYTQGFGIPRELADSAYVLELAENDVFSVDLGSNSEPSTSTLPRYREFPYTADTTLYGLPITVGSVDTTLLHAYTPFFAFDPRAKRDTFANYFINNVNLTKAMRRRDNEQGYGGFSTNIWGGTVIKVDSLLGTDSLKTDSLNRLHVINPAIASASYAYLPQTALRSIRELYEGYGRALFTEYGFRKWIAPERNAVADGFDALQQAAVVVMIENGRSGLIWDLFSSHPDIKKVIGNHFNIE
ncbi:glucoamylase family protein [Parapedobacter sp. 10938]|uniref:glucoamylase family protein n=1 Tax=Parapedobacter flavus TaxID=3110225 RepID=UPI002DB957D5|nr:glucoamylase family protein [Parapedobacter sp. 10938]MEC3878735.1 glucoamylase family protein [Parapedobacter sp. 10938]